MLQDLKRSTTKRDLQGRVKWAEGRIQLYKRKVSEYESDATGYEERLRLLEKEGECRT